MKYTASEGPGQLISPAGTVKGHAFPNIAAVTQPVWGAKWAGGVGVGAVDGDGLVCVARGVGDAAAVPVRDAVGAAPAFGFG